MARGGRYESEAGFGRVAPRALDAPRAGFASPEAFGASIGEGVQRAGGVAFQYAKLERDRQDSARLGKFQGDLLTLEQEVAFGEKGAFRAKLGDAPEAVDSAFERFEAEANKLLEALGTERQRAEAQRYLERRRARLKGAFLRHELRESDALDTETTKAGLAAARRGARLNYLDPSSEEEEGLEILQGYADRRGWDDKMLADKRAEFLAGFSADVLDSYIDNRDPEGGLAYLDTIEERLPKAIASKARKTLERQHRDRVLLEKADELVLLGDESEALDRVPGLAGDDPELASQLRSTIKERYATQRRLEKERIDDSFQSAVNQLEDSGGNIAELRGTPAWDDFSIQRRRALEERARQLQTGEDPVMGSKATLMWTDFMSMSPQEMADADLYEWLRPHLPQAKYERALDMQRAARIALGRERRSEAEKERSGSKLSTTTTLSFKDHTRNSLERLGAWPKKPSTRWSAEQRSRVNQWEEEAAIRVRDLEEQKGGKLTPEELRGVFLDMERETVRDPGWFSDNEIPLALVPQADLDDYEESEQTDEVSQIRLLIRKHGKVPTPSLVTEIRRAYIKNDAARVRALLGGE